MAFAPKLLINRVPRCEDARQTTLDGHLIFYDTTTRPSEDEQRAKRRRIEKHAENYLRGHHLHIETAGLQSVGDTRWQSPWKSAGFVPVKKPVFKSIEEMISSSTPSKSFSPQPEKRPPPRVPMKRKTKTTAKKMKHNTAFFKALPMVKQNVSTTTPSKTSAKDVGLPRDNVHADIEEPIPVEDVNIPQMPVSSLYNTKPDRMQQDESRTPHKDSLVEEREIVENWDPTTPSKSSLMLKTTMSAILQHKIPGARTPEGQTSATVFLDQLHGIIPITPSARPPQKLALLALEEMGPTPPQPLSLSESVDVRPGSVRSDQQQALVQPAQKPKPQRPTLNVDTSAVARRTRSQTRNTGSRETKLTTPVRPTEQPPSTVSHKSYIPSFPERQDSKAYSPTSFDRGSASTHQVREKQTPKRTALPPPPLSIEKPKKETRPNNIISTHSYGLRRKRASIAEDLVAVEEIQDENVEPIEHSQGHYTPSLSQKTPNPVIINQSPNKAPRSCLKPIAKTDRRNNESPVSSQQFQVPCKDLSPTLMRKQAATTVASDNTSILALAFPSVSFLPSAEPPGTAAQDDTGSLMGWSFGQEEGQLGQGGLFGRFSMISGEDEEEERDMDNGVEEAVRFLEVDYDL